MPHHYPQRLSVHNPLDHHPPTTQSHGAVDTMNGIPSLALFVSGTLSGCLLATAFFLFKKPKRPSSSLAVTEPPHAQWYPGDEQPPPFAATEMTTLDPATLGASANYPLMISGVVPRPIAFVSTVGLDGVGNLAPFSYFNAVGHDPPCVAVSICTSGVRDGGDKDTAKNIKETGEFVVNIISEWFIEAANHTCGNFDPEINEMELSGLTPIPSVKVTPPRVKESAFHMECKLKHTHDIHNSQGKVHATVVIGEVVMFHVNNAVIGHSPSGKIIVDINKYQPMSRLGGNTYARTTSIFDLPRPDRDWQNVKPR